MFSVKKNRYTKIRIQGSYENRRKHTGVYRYVLFKNIIVRYVPLKYILNKFCCNSKSI